VSAVNSDRVAAPKKRRSPRAARIMSIVPGLGQLYYGAPVRAAQYLAGVVVPAALVVVIYRWTMLDPEHPEEIGKSRGTIWEIHPVMKVEVQQPGGGWNEL